MTKELEKKESIKEAGIAACKILASTFSVFNLTSHIEQMFIDDETGEEYILNFYSKKGFNRFLKGKTSKNDDSPKRIFIDKDHNGRFTVDTERYSDSQTEYIRSSIVVREKEELVIAADELLFLHGCEEEGLSSGMPTSSQWREAVNKLRTLVYKHKKS